MKRYYGFLLIVLSSNCIGQNFDYEFFKHLRQHSLWREGLALTRQNTNDTARLWAAKIAFKAGQYDSALAHFSKVSRQQDTCLYFEAKSWYNFIYLADKQIAKADWPTPCDSLGLQLYKRMILYNRFLTHDINSNSHHQLFLEHPFKELLESRQKFKRKSAFVAAAFSALLPGMGKFYTSHRAEGWAALTQCTFLALQALEAYRLNNNLRQNERFWFFGGVFFVFYTGNIWGSALKVKVRRREFYEQENRRVFEFMYGDLDEHFRGAN